MGERHEAVEVHGAADSFRVEAGGDRDEGLGGLSEARGHGANLYRWKKKFGGMGPEELRRVIVKSGVWAIESSGVLVALSYFDSISKLNSRYDLCQVIKTTKSSPFLLSTLAELEHHMQHAIPR